MPSSGQAPHRDSHEAEIADPVGQPVAAMRIGNDSAGLAQLLAAIAKVVPRPWVALCIEGPRTMGSDWHGRWPPLGCW